MEQETDTAESGTDTVEPGTEKESFYKDLTPEQKDRLRNESRDITAKALQRWKAFREQTVPIKEKELHKDCAVFIGQGVPDETHEFGVSMDELYSKNLANSEIYGYLETKCEEISSIINSSYEIVLNNWIMILEDEYPPSTIQTFAKRRAIALYAAFLHSKPIFKMYRRKREDMIERLNLLRRKQDMVNILLQKYGRE